MSKTISISKNDGTTFAETVTKLRTKSADGGSIEWVPDDETRCESLNVTANGTYTASSAGKYGYDVVSVSVAGSSVTGKGQDGNEHTVTPDPETGMLVDEVIPSSIVVTTPPTVTTYQDGGTIDFTGIVVTAYTLDGEVWEDSSHPGGIIPVSELEFPVTTAVYDSQTESHDGYATITDTTGLPDEVIQAIPLVYGNNIWFTGAYNTGSYPDTYGPGVMINLPIDPVYSFIINNGSSYSMALCSKSSFSGTMNEFNEYGSYQYEIRPRSETINGETFYIALMVVGEINLYYTVMPTPVVMSQTNIEKCAYVILFGDRTPADASVQNIPVNWQRPGDGAVLETTFEILVGPTGGSGED